MYTKGTGSGHLARINAVYKGFDRIKANFKFYAYAPRSKYLRFLDVGIILCDKDETPSNVDIFICDWRADSFTAELPNHYAKTWIGLKRLGKMKASFPGHYHVISIEPDVKGDYCIWPIISTWPDELVSKRELKNILGFKENKKVGLLCENGAYPKHVDTVFKTRLPKDVKIFKISNSPFSDQSRNLSYHPVARLFKATDYLVIGGGYNSFHEALSYANMDNTVVINVGGDDQAIRIKKAYNWPQGKGSQAHTLATYIINYHKMQK